MALNLMAVSRHSRTYSASSGEHAASQDPAQSRSTPAQMLSWCTCSAAALIEARR